MVERRSLVEGIKPKSREEAEREEEFVFGEREATPVRDRLASNVQPEEVAKAPISTRIRADFASALKRASLERQLSGLRPSAINEILEEALRPWLTEEGYL